ncbi:unnamed protein product [Mytilus coruscus]|uniref:Uncharacterized protein n=1 Tax=Mytilus coruscus TaxID=42192 RepID=A0A6J8EXF6_MYTCO|nr:unnamed protein product [Mytilus coruscus]
MNQRTFERLKPFFVRAASPKDRLTCCCRYHVESKSLFLKCMEFRKKHIHPQLSGEEKNKFPVYEHLTDIAVATLCGKDTTNDCFNKACLDRKCTECGVRLLDFSDQELSDHPEAPTRTEVAIHVSIIYRHSVLELDGGIESFPDDPCIVTEHFFVISSDEKHDKCFTSKVQSLVKEYLDSISYNNRKKLTVRYLSCYSCEECVNGNYNMCTNNAIGRKEVVPIRPDDKGTIDDDENDNEYTMSDLIVEGTVLALYTDEENAEFYLLRASSCPEKLRTSEVDDWGVSFKKKTQKSFEDSTSNQT